MKRVIATALMAASMTLASAPSQAFYGEFVSIMSSLGSTSCTTVVTGHSWGNWGSGSSVFVELCW